MSSRKESRIRRCLNCRVRARAHIQRAHDTLPFHLHSFHPYIHRFHGSNIDLIGGYSHMFLVVHTTGSPTTGCRTVHAFPLCRTIVASHASSSVTVSQERADRASARALVAIPSPVKCCLCFDRVRIPLYSLSCLAHRVHVSGRMQPALPRGGPPHIRGGLASIAVL